MSSPYTEQQQQALDQAFSLLHEQYEGVVIAVMASSDLDGVAQESTRVYHYGGRILAIGLCVEAQDRLLRLPPSDPA